MTTIAWDGEFLAADGQITRDISIETLTERKLRKINHCWIGYAGSSSLFEMFIEWFKAQDERPDIGKNFVAVVLSDKGLFEYDDALYPIKISYNAAWGSGRDFALAALDHGATAKEAIKYASSRDVYTGGRIQVVSLIG